MLLANLSVPLTVEVWQSYLSLLRWQELWPAALGLAEELAEELLEVLPAPDGDASRPQLALSDCRYQSRDYPSSLQKQRYSARSNVVRDGLLLA